MIRISSRSFLVAAVSPVAMIIASAPALAATDAAAQAAVTVASSSAAAQPAPPPTTNTAPAATPTGTPGTSNNEIVITGSYARSLANANSIKKRSVNVVEAISAEDIGKLPDVSITDSLSRLTGVAVQESAGRAKYISIRGFGPDYTTATLNGRTVATVDDNRRFDYGQYPGDLFQEIEVIKTPSADLINFGLAGTVNLQTYDPLTQKNTLAVNIQGEMGQYKKVNPDGTNKGYKGSLIYMHKFADDTLGVSLGLSAIKDPTQDYHWATGGGNGNYNDPDALGNIGPSDIQNYVNTNTLTRQSGFAHIVYRPDSKFEMSADALYTQSKLRELSRGWEMPLASWSRDTEVPGSEQASNGYVTSEQWHVFPVLRNDFNTSNGKTVALGANMKYHFTDDLKFVLDANYSRATRHDNTYEIYGGSTTTPGLATVTRLPDGTYGVNIAGINYADPTVVSLTDPQGWNQVGFNNVPDFKDTVKGLRAELDGDLHGSFFSGWEAGATYNDEKKVSNYSGYFICLPGPASVGGCGNDNAVTTSVAIPSSIVEGQVEPYAVTGTDLIALNSIAAQNILRTAPQSDASNVSRDWTVEEKILTGFLQANFDTGAGSDFRLSGNIGAQIVHTDQSSLGFGATSATTVIPQSGGAKYTYVLPSLNANMQLVPGTILRLAVSRTLARATMDDENASYSVNSCGTTNGVPTGCTTVPAINGKVPVLQGQGGNPSLRPYLSNNADVSLEKYFMHDRGKIAIAAYYKRITNFTTQNLNLNSGNINNNGPQDQSVFTSDCSAFSGLLNGAALAANQTYSCWSTAPTNDGKGWVFGYEASGTIPLDVLTPALDGFGIIGQYAHTASKIKFSNGAVITLPGLSRSVYQAQLFFEKWGFNARVSLTHRAPFLGDYTLFSAQVTANLTKAQTTLDAQIGYDWKSGPLNGLSIYLQGHNLTNPVLTSYVNGDPNQVNIRDRFGATYLAGLTYRF